MLVQAMFAAAIAMHGGQDQASEAARAAAEAMTAAREESDEAIDQPISCRRDGNTLELNACAALDLSLEVARMEAYFEAARRRAMEGDENSAGYGQPTQQLAYLEASQFAWGAYAEFRCDGVSNQWAGGTIRTIMTLGCKIETTRQRTRDIWADYLTFWDSTPPIYPEPLEQAPVELPEPLWPY